MQNAVFSCRKKRSTRFLHKIKKFGCFFLFLLIGLVLIYNLQVIPVLSPLTKAHVTTTVTREVQQAIRNNLGDCLDIVRITYGSDGTVVALETDSAAIAKASADITQSVIQTLCNDRRLYVRFPIGNLSGGALLTGRGPDIRIPVTVSPTVMCEIENEFSENGINQTLHRIVAEVEIEVFALLPFATQKIPVETEYCLAETVIVGKVPDAYTKIHRMYDDISESEIDDIYDFGATIE